MLPRKFGNWVWSAILCLLLEIFQKKKTIGEKDKTSRIQRDDKDFLQFLSYSASVIDNIHQTLTPRTHSLATALTVLIQGQSKFSSEVAWGLAGGRDFLRTQCLSDQMVSVI